MSNLRYYLLQGDLTRIFVQRDGDSRRGDAVWSVISKPEHVDILLQNLNIKGENESKLFR